MSNYTWVGTYDKGDIRDLLAMLEHAHAYLDEHPEQYPPRPARPMLDGIVL